MSFSPILPFVAQLFPWKHRELVKSLIQREIGSRYRNSFAGVVWSIINPIFTLIIYTVVFKRVFTVQWPGSNQSAVEFALLIFIGMTIYSLFTECILRAPVIIVANTNFVKKIKFPLEIFPWVILGTAGFHLGVNFLVWLLFYGATTGIPPITCLLYPLILLPTLLYILGFSWIFSALGVYFRDVSHIITALLLPLMFLTPIFYPSSALPADLRGWIELNPLAHVIEDARMVLFWGQMPNFFELGISLIAAAAFSILGLYVFQKSREGFSDVL